MTVLVIVAAVLATAVLLVALVKVVRSGGYPSPSARVHEWTTADQAPERPYRDLPRVA